MCQAFCPASPTKVFFGSNIDGASSASGERYADSENAFAYRKALRADCTCNGRDPAGLAPVDLTLDTSLRPGDVIATTNGLVAYSGVKVGNDQTAEFTPVASYPGLTAEVRARLGEMKVAPVSAETSPTDAPPSPSKPARRRRAGRDRRRRRRRRRRGTSAREARLDAAHRPTMTPITFGADRYFSSIAARAAARFSGVSSPRFSARIIQQ